VHLMGGDESIEVQMWRPRVRAISAHVRDDIAIATRRTKHKCRLQVVPEFRLKVIVGDLRPTNDSHDPVMELEVLKLSPHRYGVKRLNQLNARRRIGVPRHDSPWRYFVPSNCDS
jgi:hypothetical protein